MLVSCGFIKGVTMISILKIVAVGLYFGSVFGAIEFKMQDVKDPGASTYSQWNVPYDFLQRSVLIFLDESEKGKKFGAVSHSLFKAICQNAGPIICSASLIENVFSDFFDQISDLKILIDEFYNLARKEKLFHSFSTLKALGFDEKSWLFKKINESLYLLIPINHLNSIRVSLEDAQKFSADDPVSHAELVMGLKVNHMKSTTIADIIKNEKTRLKTSGVEYFIQPLFNKDLKKSDIFCVESDYRELKNILPVEWSLVFDGHGSVGQEFRLFL